MEENNNKKGQQYAFKKTNSLSTLENLEQP